MLFSIQIYFDFSGYSDIARGLAKLMGIDLMVNFKQPYFSSSPSEFWKRWHISLSTWLRDYVYIPIGGNRRSFIRTLYNLMITMLLGGLWHGASWNFILWGGIHGFYLILDKLFIQMEIFQSISSKFKITKIIIFYFLILFTWIPFRTTDIASSILFFEKIIFLDWGIDIGELLFLFLFIHCYFQLITLHLSSMMIFFIRKFPNWFSGVIISLGIFGIIFSMVTQSSSARPFIYFQF